MKIKNLQRFFTYMGRSKGYLVLSFIYGLMFAASSMAVPYFAGKAIDAFTMPDGMLVKLILVMIGLIIIACVSQLMLLRCNNSLTYDAAFRLRNDCYS